MKRTILAGMVLALAAVTGPAWAEDIEKEMTEFVFKPCKMAQAALHLTKHLTEDVYMEGVATPEEISSVALAMDVAAGTIKGTLDAVRGKSWEDRMRHYHGAVRACLLVVLNDK